MKYLMTVILYFISVSVFSQCDYIVNEKDEFTGEKKLKTEAVIERNIIGPTAHVYFTRINNNYFFTPRLTFNNAQSMVVDKGGKIMLKLMNDSIITLHSTDVFRGEIMSSYSATITTLTPDYDIDSSQLEIIKRYPLVKFRLYLYPDEYIEKEIKKKFLKDLSQAAKCIMLMPAS